MTFADTLTAAERALLDGLDPDVRARALQHGELCFARGIRIGFRQGYRSFAEQAALYAKGRTVNGARVTNARPGYSWHNWRRAYDVVIEGFPGDPTPNDVYDGPWSLVGELGELAEMDWGGRWKRPDLPHFESPQSTLAMLVRQHPQGLA